MALRIVKFHHSQPNGGYTFMIDGTVISDRNPKVVISKIAEYRKNNGIPSGDPEHDLAMFTRTKYPWLVIETKDKSPDEEGSDQHLAFDYVNSVWKSAPLRQEEPSVQAKKFKTCLECKHYKPLNVDGETIRKSTAISSALLADIISSKDHGFCEHHLWVCSVACSMKDNSAMANPEKFDGCWFNRNV